MMMLKKFRCLVLVMALVLVVVSSSTFAAKKPVKLVYGHVFAAEHFFCKSDLYFKKLVEKNSKGKILVDYFPASQLGTEQEQLQATKSNAQQMFIASLGNLTQYWPKMSTFNLPYIYRDEAHHIKVANNLYSLIDPDEFAAKTSMRILYVRIRAPRHLTTKFPVNKLEDIKGLKIRVPENPVLKAIWKALGTIPTVIPGADVYTALATGTVDAQENPFDYTYTMKFYEIVKYCALTAHMRDITLTVINNKCWNGLTARQKKIVQNAAKKASEMGMKDVKEDEEKNYNLLVKAGMKFTKPDLAPFREKAKTMWSQFGDPKLIKKIEAVK
jgi:tripartite ATP-independent transporter DctP family solute receptor